MHLDKFRSTARGRDASGGNTTAPDADPEDVESDEPEKELELDDVAIDEAALPPLDMDDPENVVHDYGHDDLIDRSWLERAVEDDGDEERARRDDFGLTIDLGDAEDEDDPVQVLELDVGSLLTPLPADGTELDLDPGGALDRDGALGIGALHDMLLPEEDDRGVDDREIGDDARFPVFDDSSDIEPRRAPDDAEELPEEELS
jgi:hypothetical protein